VKLRHPLTGAIYERLEGGRCKVTEADGRSGIFDVKARWISGDVREADLHFVDWIAGAQVGTTGTLTVSASLDAAPAARSGAAVPAFQPRAARAGGSGKGKGMDLGLSGRKALITAASRGIGLSIARQFADDGCDVAICARSEGGLEAAKKELEQRGVKAFAKAVDVSDGAALRAFVAEAAGALGGLDIFVSNASAGGGMGEQAWQATFDIDVMSAARGVEAALPFLAKSEAGSIVFISSTAALEYLGVPQPYNAMKAALIAHAGDLAQALAKQGIRVNTVSPGPIYFEGGNWEMIKNAMPAVYQGALAQCAIGRMGTPEEVARAVVFLASPAASLITGANLVCDGGFTKGHHF
jgi:NAD(P)-dependent dehydrogenase (short-subunit alcohol dehydrogenase family)